ALVEDQEYSSIRPLIDWLDYNGYKVVTKPAKEFTDSTGRRKIKGNMDIELTIDALELVDVVDHYVIFSGDGDFRTLVEALQRKGRKASIVSSIQSQPPMISDELRRQADNVIDLASLQAEIGRDPSQRPARRSETAGYHKDESECTPRHDRGDAARSRATARLLLLPPTQRLPRPMARAGAGLVQRSRAYLPSRRRRDGGTAPRRRPGAGTARRQPYRAALHRRLRGNPP